MYHLSLVLNPVEIFLSRDNHERLREAVARSKADGRSNKQIREMLRSAFVSDAKINELLPEQP